MPTRMTRGLTLGNFLAPASFWRPDYVSPSRRLSSWIEHAPFAFWLVDALRPRVVVELGTHTGYSYFAFCQAIQRLGLPTQSYAIDTWEGDPQTGYYGPEVFEELAAEHNARFGAFSALVRSRFDDALVHFEDNSIDLLHIDGYHGYETVRHDFESWRPKLAQDAVVLIHDTNVRQADFGVQKLWLELREEQAGFEFLHGHGLGVLEIGDGLPATLKALGRAEAKQPLAAEIREAYACLGEAIAIGIRHESSQAAAIESQATFEAQRNELSCRCQQLEREVEASGRARAELYEALEVSRATTVELQATVQDHRVTTEAVRSAHDHAERRLQAAELELSAARDEIKEIKESTIWQATAPFRRLRTHMVVKRRNRVTGAAAAPPPNDVLEKEAISSWYQRFGRKVTVVIPSYNDHKLLTRCIGSIRDTVRDDRVDIVVVDDASPDAEHQSTLDRLVRDNVRVIRQETNGGFARAANAGIRAARGRDVILLNSDTEASPGWLEALQYGAYSDDLVGLAGARLLYPDGRIQYAGTYRHSGESEWFDHRYRSQPAAFGPASVPSYVLAITGACVYMKRSVIDRVGEFDEAFGMGFEDVDYAVRVWRAGFRCLYYPAATLVHHESATRGDGRSERELASLQHFWEKWGAWFDERPVTTADGRIRVIYVLQDTGVAGGHRNIFEHLNRLAGRGFDIELYALAGAPEWFTLEVPVRSFDNYEALIQALSAEDAIKVATWWETAIPVWLSSVCRGVPAYLVSDIETSYYPDDVRAQDMVIASYRPEFSYFTISNWNVEKLRELGLKSTLVPCGIDRAIFRPIDVEREPDVLAAVGRSHHLKNLALTLEGWNRVRPSKPRVWMYGVEPRLAEADRRFTYFERPSDEEINELLNRATVFAQTSRHEGFCLTILEAMAAGVPVITTDAHGNRDFSLDGHNCLVVRQDDPDDVAVKLEQLFADADLQERLRRGGYETAAAYEWSAVIDRLEQYFHELGAIRSGFGSVTAR